MIWVDAFLAYGHFLFIGTMIACLGMETALIRANDFSAPKLQRLALVDMYYGLSALMIILFGVGRVMFGLKDTEYYIHNHVFWTKMALFADAGLASAPPTINILRWRKAASADPTFEPPPRKLRSVRGHIIAEWILLALIPIAAVLMAQGVGYTGSLILRKKFYARNICDTFCVAYVHCKNARV